MHAILRSTTLSIFGISELEGPPPSGLRNVTVRTVGYNTGVGLGFCFRGGRDEGTPPVVSKVDVRGSAAVAGLVIGDELIEINGYQFSGLTHAQVAAMINRQIQIGEINLLVTYSSQAQGAVLGSELLSSSPSIDHSSPVRSLVISIALPLCQISVSPVTGEITVTEAVIAGVRDQPSSAVLRVRNKDRDTVAYWTHLLRTNRDLISCPQIFKPGAPAGFGGQLQRLVKVSPTKICLIQSNSSHKNDGILYLALTDHDISLFSEVPCSAKDLIAPLQCWPLFGCDVQNLHDDKETFTIVMGDGSHLELSVETPCEAQNLSAAVVKLANYATQVASPRHFQALFDGRDAILTVGFFDGIRLHSVDIRGDQQHLWTIPFWTLKGTEGLTVLSSVTFFDHQGTDKRIQVQNPSLVVSVVRAVLRAFVASTDAIR